LLSLYSLVFKTDSSIAGTLMQS